MKNTLLNAVEASDVHRRSRLILFANRVDAVPDVHCQRLYQMHNEDELVIGNEVCRGIGGNINVMVIFRLTLRMNNHTPFTKTGANKVVFETVQFLWNKCPLNGCEVFLRLWFSSLYGSARIGGM
ncbi:hypothetical protein T4B_2464 [Trichinella pseudospiralis]|uniref:Uncharacterized protein n=1 Tax=Trichinella pseudospiralis TaxID=6337 RepID=A0A0V1IDG1_TRIPS|nr:hypothetical protein T4A_13863 [Trichinella pseudospiralis]KRY65237.1 hypothetical protein T4A_6310 [Trichinella pseudospiralis]KRZ07220.1 hypothetical protein T4B_691 [Trichinella pseudospiralis]KRZ20875.1 hypothetical protein T4B_2464 [Trichinella pseudospiralis]